MHRKKKNRYKLIYDELEILKPQSIIEIGVATGANLIKMCSIALRHRKKIRYFGFDLFKAQGQAFYEKEHTRTGVASKKEIEVLIKESKLNIIYELIEGFTQKTLLRFKPVVPIDFILIDGGHSFDTIANDWKYCEKLMHKDTTVIFDDYVINKTDYGCNNVIDNLPKDKYKIEFSEEADITKKEHTIKMVKVVQVMN